MTKTKNSIGVRNLTFAGVCLALCLLLPFLTGQIPEIGSMLAPMHFPVLLCGFIGGWPLGLVVGFVAPLLRSLLFGMPPMMLVAVPMAFELAAYGAVAAMFYQKLPQKPGMVYVALIASMLAGRVVWGAASFVIYRMVGTPFTMELFLAGAFIKAVPGIMAQIILIPPIVLALRRAKLIL